LVCKQSTRRQILEARVNLVLVALVGSPLQMLQCSLASRIVALPVLSSCTVLRPLAAFTTPSATSTGIAAGARRIKTRAMPANDEASAARKAAESGWGPAHHALRLCKQSVQQYLRYIRIYKSGEVCFILLSLPSASLSSQCHMACVPSEAKQSMSCMHWHSWYVRVNNMDLFVAYFIPTSIFFDNVGTTSRPSGYSNFGHVCMFRAC
jgi:hypothetical protein